MRTLALSVITALVASAASAVEIPQASPGASVSQILGTTRIEIQYHRPSVKGRTIWGDLVPYGEVWRLGANDATTISFDDPVRIDGKEIPAGTYGLFAIPGRDSWTVIVNKVAKQWGAFSYEAKEDVLRFSVKPEPTAATEWMQFTLTPLAENQIEVAFAWDQARIAFPLAVKVRELTWARLETALKANPIEAGTYARAAGYAIATGERVADGLAWIEKALAAKRTAFSLESHARLLAANGKKAEAIVEMKEARKLAEGQLPPEFFKRVDAALEEWQTAKQD